MQVYGVLCAELQKIRHDPMELFTRAVQPLLWLLLFGVVMLKVKGLAPEGMSYLDYLSAGILAQSVLFVAIFSAYPRYGTGTSEYSTGCS